MSMREKVEKNQSQDGSKLRLSSHKKRHTSKNWLFVKVLQFSPNLYETWSRLTPHELIILTKFHEDWAKIVELLLIANFGMCPVFYE